MEQYQEYMAQAHQLVRDNMVISGAEITRCDSPEAPSVMMEPLDMNAENIDQWQECGFDIVVLPIAAFNPDFHNESFRLIASLNAFIADHSDRIIRIDNSADVDIARNNGRTGVLICLHQAEHFRTVDDVDMFYRYGQRSSLITSHGQNSLGSPVGERSDGGLSHFGVNIIRRMNELGMIVDVSHCAERTAIESAAESSAPVLCSHANTDAICPNPRNKSDVFIKEMARGGGVIGIMCLRMLVTPQEPTGVEDMLDHMAHVSDLVGPEHVGLGYEVPTFGWDPVFAAASPIPLPSYMKNEGVQRKLDIPELSTTLRTTILTAAMLKRGWPESMIKGIVGGNFERVFRQILGT